MRVLVVNAGSSSLKLAVIDDDHRLRTATVDDWDGADLDPLTTLLDDLDVPVDAVGHRVVHGGEIFTAPTLLDDEAVRAIEALTPLAPLHQPRSLAGVRVALRALPDVPHVGCFDTTFHATIGPAAATYALPEDWRSRWPLRRFGFHGLSHAHASRRAATLAGTDVAGLRIVTCHLGAGASLCAVVGGCSVATTMGFTPLEGLVMQTRSGDVDPGLVLWLIEEAGLSPAEVRRGLEERSGLAGLAGTSGDLRDLLARRADGDDRASLAFDVYVHRLAQGIAAMAASAGGLDLLVFTGGIGEHAHQVRQAAASRLAWIDAGLGDLADDDPDRGDRELTDSTPQGVRVFVVAADEASEIARSTRALLA